MPRRRRGRSSSVALKAGLTDADIFAGAMNSQTGNGVSDNEQYWMLFKTHPWVHSCIRLIGNAVTQESYDLTPMDDAKPLADNDPDVENLHQALRVIFVGKCNTFRKFRKCIVMDSQTYGVGYARKKYGQQDGKQALVGLERLNPRRISPHLSSDRTEIDFYYLRPEASNTTNNAAAQVAYQLSGVADNTTPLDGLSAKNQIPADEMIVFSLDEGGDDVFPSPSPLEALDLTCATDVSVRHHRRKFFTNGTTMGNVIAMPGANEDQVRDTQKKLGAQTAGNASFRNLIVPGDAKVQSLLASGGRDFDFIKASELTLEEICAVYSIPPSKLRDISGSMGQAGKGQDDEAFEQECILPIEESFYETMTLEVLHKEFGIDYFSMTPARRNKIRLDKFDAAVQLVKFGGSGNQALDLVGMPKVDDPKMDEPLFIGATGKTGVTDDEIEAPPPVQGQEPEATDAENMDNENTAKGGRGSTKRPKARSWY